MPERDGYIPGVPCWVDTSQPEPEAAIAFYREVFGWEFEDAMPPGSAVHYWIARLRGGDVAAVTSIPEGAPRLAAWNTYVWVESADATAASVREAGGTVVEEPFDVLTAGRMAVCADPECAVFRLWQPGEHRGARIVNEHGSLTFNDLRTRDAERAAAFYGAVFGWERLDLPSGSFWALPEYGDYLEQLTPGIKRMTAEFGVPGFENVVAAISPLTEGDGEAGWGVTFATDDADATAARAAELGGEVLEAPADAPFTRTTLLRDPQGATFRASKFVPENKDLVASPGSSAASA